MEQKPGTVEWKFKSLALIRSRIAWATLLALIVFVVFANCIPGTFLWDDQQFLLDNRYMSSWQFIPQFFSRNLVDGAGLTSNLYRPLQLFSHFLDIQIWGLNPWGHRFTNVLLQSLTAGLWFFVFLRLLGDEQARSSRLASFLAVLLYFTHPIQSEDVGYISGRGDILVMLFMGISMLSFPKRPAASILAALAAILSKENGLLTPFFLLGCDWVICARESRKINWKPHLPFFAIAAIYLALRMSILNFQNFLNFYNSENPLTRHLDYRIYTYLSTLPKALQLVLAPVDLHHARTWKVFPSFDNPWVIGGAGLLGSWIGALLFSLRGSRLVTFALIWVILATLPTSNLAVLINALFYDHWFILPALGLFLALAVVLKGSLEQSNRALVVAFASIPLWSLTLEQNRAWREPISLYEKILSYEPDSVEIMNNLAMHLSARNSPEDRDRALQLYHRAIATNDSYAQTHHNLALFLSVGKSKIGGVGASNGHSHGSELPSGLRLDRQTLFPRRTLLRGRGGTAEIHNAVSRPLH